MNLIYIYTFLWMVCLKIDSALKNVVFHAKWRPFGYILLQYPLLIRFIHLPHPPGKSTSRCGLEPFEAARRTTRQQSWRRRGGRLEANLCKAWQGSKALPCKGGRCGRRREVFKHQIIYIIHNIYIYRYCNYTNYQQYLCKIAWK